MKKLLTLLALIYSSFVFSQAISTLPVIDTATTTKYTFVIDSPRVAGSAKLMTLESVKKHFFSQFDSITVDSLMAVLIKTDTLVVNGDSVYGQNTGDETIVGGGQTSVVQSGHSYTISSIAPDTAVTQPAGDSTTMIATTAFVDRSVDSLGNANYIKKAAIAFNVYEGGGVVTTGAKNYVINIPYNCTITGFYLYSTNSSGVALNSNTVVDVWKTTEGSLPTAANTIFSGNEPTLSASAYDSDNALNVSVAAGDVVIISVDSNSAATNLNLIINYTKN